MSKYDWSLLVVVTLLSIGGVLQGLVDNRHEDRLESLEKRLSAVEQELPSD